MVYALRTADCPELLRARAQPYAAWGSPQRGNACSQDRPALLLQPLSIAQATTGEWTWSAVQVVRAMATVSAMRLCPVEVYLAAAPRVGELHADARVRLRCAHPLHWGLQVKRGP
jgi:hypothetical protein